MSPAARPARPIAFAHRGASGHAPENTLAAFRLALELGATGIESDTWLAADGVPVLVHDLTIRRPGRRIFVTRSTSAELAGWDVPTLAGLYAGCGTGFELSLDVEHPEVALPVIEVAEAFGAIERLWLCHEDEEVVAALRKRSRRVRLVHSIHLRAIREPFEMHVARLARLRLDVLNMPWRAWSAERVALAHRHGLLAFGWDAHELPAIERALALRLDAIYSDYPDRLVAAIAGHRRE